MDTGPAARIVDAYLKVQAGAEGVMEWQGDDRYGDDDVKLDAIRILGADGLPTPVVVSSEPFRVQMDIDVGRVPQGLTIGVRPGPRGRHDRLPQLPDRRRPRPSGPRSSSVATGSSVWSKATS